ncbi:glutamate dehydrogenase (NAD(P)+) [Saccharopolyspora antimicrobica]|uniref:Glutamate dehydrogenase n=1 Tax=Saccharopolyspora antimicrobica TaxID=455193 RepID=A0A1I4SGX0_9PSEU|nr:Glu/Leu/Phe/Val dehydrogenase dimerization domain-containing protein [Saccharopolyspora antimicrobica]RKT87738.1 glutamate dehydrogenase (NAD(P)+) [Saccharopolyspora antimicrobica]SFM63654.1 glutamate dehydrogenase (NAD(P)+) [Saccharopolyspora antimicrobica]
MPDLLQEIDEWGPEKVVCVSDARTGMRGVLVIDNTARGTGKGGTRMSPTVTVGEIARLARVMTWKWAAVDLFHGGAKAGIFADPASPDKERIVRAFARRLADQIPASYVAGLDMGMTEQDAAIIQDELGDRGAAVGVPELLGGVPYDQLGVTGHGVAEAAEAALTRQGRSIAGARVAVQGFGAVGAAAARRLHELGAQLVALSTIDGSVHDPDGLDVPKWLEARAEFGDACVAKASAAQRVPRGEELLVDCDVLIPAAGQDVIDEAMAAKIRAGLVVEGANLPTTPGARELLAEREITVVPDFIANAGGAIAAGFAMDARHSPFRPEPTAILAEVAERTRNNTVLVLDTADRSGLLPHEAALDLAKQRVRTAMELRGRLPRPA